MDRVDSGNSEEQSGATRAEIEIIRLTSNYLKSPKEILYHGLK